ncbi:MAG: HAMP domain-containing protein [Verrucomicrobiaceae bacterium]|nr:HAMP domain-containing protein [Verrucomicrobiaceae bacterium]
MKWPSSSIRTRIQLWHGLLLACILVALGIAAWRLRWNDELRRVDRELNEALSQMHRILGAGRPAAMRGNAGTPSPPEQFTMPPDIAAQIAERGCYYALWTRAGKLVAHSSNAPATLTMPKLESGGTIVTHWRNSGDAREGYVFTPPGECIFAGVSVAQERAAMVRFGWWLVALGGGVLGIGLLVDAWIVRRAIQPVEDIIGAAERISRGHLSARIDSDSASHELKRLTKVLNETFASLDAAFSQQARFSGDVAHELRTPVAVIVTDAQNALERERSAEEYRETIATHLRSAQRMSALIESLLDLAQIQSHTDAAHDPCDLGALTNEVAESLRSLAEQQGITIETSLSPAPCTGNTLQLVQIITNLVSNAIQHNRSGGHVRISSKTEDGRAVLRVENSGPGISPEHLPHIFDRFYRTDASRNRKTGGVGLGLAICKAIADAHGAELTASSQPGASTEFALRMPSSAS